MSFRPVPFRRDVARDAGRIEIERLEDRDALVALVPCWRTLSAEAFEQNINYEPEPLLALLDAFELDGVLVLAFRRDGVLVGLWPLQRRRLLPLPLDQLSTLHTPHVMASVPLIREGHVDECIDAFLGWLDARDRPTVVTLSEVVDRSAFWPRLVDAAERRPRVIERVDRIERPALVAPHGTWEDHLRRTLSGKGRNTFARKRRRLRKRGGWEVRRAASVLSSAEGAAGPSSPFQTLLEDLVRVEASGWKGARGSAIGRDPRTARFVDALARHAAARERLFLVVGYVDGRAVAGQLGIVNDGEALIYKLGHDEAFARDSPGAQLMMDIVRHSLESETPYPIDSCAEPRVRVFADALPDRRTVEKIRLSSTHGRARATLGALAWLRERRRASNDASVHRDGAKLAR